MKRCLYMPDHDDAVSREAMERIANPPTPVRIRPASLPLILAYIVSYAVIFTVGVCLVGFMLMCFAALLYFTIGGLIDNVYHWPDELKAIISLLLGMGGCLGYYLYRKDTQ
jgi:hypothetical protein